ncbi:MAG: transglycosylase SLT domain-containing protein, partial [Pseudomonadota bacterium]
MGFRVIALLAFVWVSGAAALVPPPSLKPEAPASPYLDRAQAERLRQVFESLDDRQYQAAKDYRVGLTDALAQRIATWSILRSNAPDLIVEEYDVFLDANPDWPNPLTLQRKAEGLMDEDTPASTIIEFFQNREPVSGFGKLHLGRALIEIGNRDAARTYIRKAWIEHNFNARDSAMILREFGRYLSQDDHFAKADQALFSRRTGGVEDVEDLLRGDRKKEITVRRALILGRRSGLRAFDDLPARSQRDSGVLHAMTRYLRRNDREEEAIEMAGLAPINPDDLRNPAGWHYERRLLARWSLKNGRFDDAYNLSAYSGLSSGVDFAEAEFMAGWVALRFLNDPSRARAHFDFLITGVNSPISLARGNYWLGRAYSAMGDETRARSHYLVASDYPYTYYGQMSVETLGRGAPLFSFPEARVLTDADRELLRRRDLARALHILDHIDQDLTYRRFALALDDQLTEQGEILAFAELVRDADEYDLIVRAGKATRRAGAAVPEVIYPVIPIPEAATQFVEKPLILGLSRQESEFKVNAVSSARAKGLMQLLNSTAKITARKEKLPYQPDRLLTDPDYNLT